MRWRAFLLVSLAANLLLAAGWILSAGRASRGFNRADILPATNAAASSRTNVLVRKQFFTWQQVESDDYPTYIHNLRDIGCPEQTVRDIIIADVNALYSRKRALEIVTPEQQWWRTEPDTNVVQASTAKIRELEQERRELLARLLGTNWETGDLVSLPRPSRPGIVLDGPVLGTLPTDVKQTLQEINARAQDRLTAYTDAQRAAGKPVDPAELARLRQQTRAELAAVLSPQQLEEFLLRYSQNATALRAELGQLKHFNATPDEFRALFRSTDTIDQQLQLLAGATDPNSVAQRRSLEDQRLALIKNTLGAERYAQFQLLHDPGFRDAYAAAEQAGSPESAPTLYDINQAAQAELARIRGDTNLTAEQKSIELKKAELEQLKAVAQALGQDLPAEPPPPPKPVPKTVHVIKPGEGLGFLAQFYGVDPNALRAANPNLDFSKLKGGETVSIPVTLLPPIPVITTP
jgi:LysM repeat protein